jgi:glycosyltransferase involved in cell wall biosynthesis
VSEPRISVVVPVHNCERYLRSALDSVLGQNPPPFEVTVVDDGSTDDSLAVAQRFGAQVRCVAQARRGVGGARNAGLAASSGDYVAFLDADDLWTARALRSLLAPLAADSRLDLAFGHVRHFISRDLDRTTASRLLRRPGLEPGYLAGAMLVRRGAFDRVGGFREDIAIGDFIDWMARARECGLREAIVGEHVLWRRLHGSNHGRRAEEARTDYARVLKAALDRRRGTVAGDSASAQRPL